MVGIIGVVAGFLLAIGWEWNKGRISRKGHWGMLREEVSICEKIANNYLNRSISAPLYRFPTIAFKVSFPVLVSYAGFAKMEFSNLVEFYSWCEDINRGLDYATEAVKAGDSDQLQIEERRIHSKCEKLLSDYYGPAVKILEKHR